MKTKLIILTLLLAANSLNMMAQSGQIKGPFSAYSADISLLNQAFSAKHSPRISEQFSLSKENPNALQAVFSGLFIVYKSFLSSQDNQQCSFHPSCSEFGLEAVKKLGVIRGVICTCDRLTRCNGFSPEQYEIDMERRRLKDPVKW